jgi:hypothetical protein
VLKKTHREPQGGGGIQHHDQSGIEDSQALVQPGIPRRTPIRSHAHGRCQSFHECTFEWDVRFEVYNVANHLVTSSINVGGFSGPTIVNWGQKTGTTPPRTMQATARLSF